MPPDFQRRSRVHQQKLGAAGAAALLDSARRWNLAHVLRDQGSIVFPHATLSVCGHHIAAAVNACLDTGADTVIALGVLHALSADLLAARQRVLAGGDPEVEPTRGIQGTDLSSGDHWLSEFSLSHFEFLWRCEIARRGIKRPPRLLTRFPHLAAGHPETLPGFAVLRKESEDAVIVVTTDPMHHGVGYGDEPEMAVQIGQEGYQLATERVRQNIELLCSRDLNAFIDHCAQIRSDGRDVGQTLAALRPPGHFELHDVVLDDMTGPYESPDPTWVAGALISLTP